MDSAYEPLKVAVPVEVLMPAQLTFSVCLAWVNVTQPLMVCGPSMVLVPARLLMVALNPESSTRSSDELVPATELVEMIETVPTMVTVTEEPRKLSTHVVLPSPVKVTLPVAESPLAAILPLRSDLGHLTLMPPSVSWEFVDVAATAPPAGVRVANAGAAATASTLSMATVRIRPRVVRLFM